MLPTRKSVPRSSRQLDHTKTSWPSLRDAHCSGMVMFPVHQVWPKPSCEAQWKEEEDNADRGRVLRQDQGMKRPGVRQVPEGSGEQGKMEKTGCKIICGAPTTLAVEGLMIMMMMITLIPYLPSLPSVKKSETNKINTDWNKMLQTEKEEEESKKERGRDREQEQHTKKKWNWTSWTRKRKKEEEELTVQWLKTLATATLAQSPTPLNQNSRETNQMPSLATNNYQDRWHQIKAMWEAAENWTQWSLTKKKKKTDCHQMKAGGQHFHQRRAVQTSLTHLIHQHLKVRQPAPRKLSMSHPWSMRLTTTKWGNVDSWRLVHMTDIKIQNNWHLRQAKMTFAIPVQWKRDYENPRAHSNKTTDYSGKYDNVGDGKKERKKLWSHNLRTRHNPRP